MSDYWKKRQEEKLLNILDDADVTAEYLAKLYQKSSLYLNKKIQGIFDTYRAKNNLSIQEAKALINSLENPHDYNELLRKLKNGPTGQEKKELIKKLDAPAYRYRISRLENIQNDLDILMQSIYSTEKEVSTLSYINSAFDGYHRNIFNIQHSTDVAYQFDALDPTLVDGMLKSRWSGENYSERIWNNTDELTYSLKDEMMMGLLTGKTEREMQDSIAERFSVGAYKARRLVETESAAVTSFVDQLAFEDAGIRKEVFRAVHDFKTSKVCQKHDGAVVEVGKGEIGKDIPPLHPHCRSVMEPYIEGVSENMVRRQRNPITGEEETVNANETYDDWLKRQQDVHGIDTVETFQKKAVNLSSDRRQYKYYKDVIGAENMPDSLAKFQEMKYNNTPEWELMKKYKRSRSIGKLSAFSSFDDYRKYHEIIQNNIVGLTTSDGIKIISQSDHFIERVLGTTVKEGRTEVKREGVQIDDIIDTLLKPVTTKDKLGEKGTSRKYIGSKIEVTVNPETGNLIQTNPKKRSD